MGNALEVEIWESDDSDYEYDYDSESEDDSDSQSEDDFEHISVYEVNSKFLPLLLRAFLF